MTEIAHSRSNKSLNRFAAKSFRINGAGLEMANGEAEQTAPSATNGLLSAISPREPETDSTPAEIDPSLQAEILATIPHLRAFALSLARNTDRADDLVQETLLRAYTNIRRFEPGSNLNAWLITILRNQFYSERRRGRREIEDSEGIYASTMVIAAEQSSRAECEEFCNALDSLPDDMREALVLIGGYGFSYIEAAELCACAVGTIKSRVSRARAQLTATLLLQTPGQFLDEAISHSVAIQAEQSRSRWGA
jgi:RNA polymerase sigma-70 factor (ECF subfamily)